MVTVFGTHKQWYLPFKYTHIYNSTIAYSTDKMLLNSLSYEYSCKCFRLIVGTIFLLSWRRTFHSYANHESLQHFFLGYFYSLPEYNYVHQGSNHSWHHTTAFLPCFLSFVRNLSKIQPINDPGETLLAITLI